MTNSGRTGMAPVAPYWSAPPVLLRCAFALSIASRAKCASAHHLGTPQTQSQLRWWWGRPPDLAREPDRPEGRSRRRGVRPLVPAFEPALVPAAGQTPHRREVRDVAASLVRAAERAIETGL